MLLLIQKIQFINHLIIYKAIIHYIKIFVPSIIYLLLINYFFYYKLFNPQILFFIFNFDKIKLFKENFTLKMISLHDLKGVFRVSHLFQEIYRSLKDY